MILSLFQMCIPVILIGCVLRAIILLTQVPEKSFYALVMLMADVVGLVSFITFCNVRQNHYTS